MEDGSPSRGVPASNLRPLTMAEEVWLSELQWIPLSFLLRFHRGLAHG